MTLPTKHVAQHGRGHGSVRVIEMSTSAVTVLYSDDPCRLYSYSYSFVNIKVDKTQLYNRDKVKNKKVSFVIFLFHRQNTDA